MSNRLVILKDPIVAGDNLYPVTMASGVICQGTNQEYTLQYLVNQLENFNGGGGGGGSTVTGSSITLSTTPQTFMTIDGSTSYTIKLPSTDPWAGNYASSSHDHGDITNGGQITASAVSAASGQSLVVVSNSSIKKSAIVLGTDTTKFLRNDGQWAVPPGSGGGGSTTLSGLTDVTISGASNGQVLTYSSGAWVNSAVPTELPSLTGNGGKVLAVNSGATGVEWITNSGGGGGSTVTIPGSDITLSGSNQLYISVNGVDRNIKLPSLGTINYPSGNVLGGSISGSSTQGGTGQTSNQVDIASGDRLVIGDWSARGTTQSGSHYPLKLSSISFGSSTTQFLRNDGQWATPAGGGGGGGSTVTLPSGYSASTGITLNSSTPTTVATVDGVNLNLIAPAAGYSDGLGIATTGTAIINAVAAECQTIGKALVPKENEYILPVLSSGSERGASVSQYDDGDQNYTGDDITGTWPNGEILGNDERTQPNYLHVSLPTALSVLLTKLWEASNNEGRTIADIIEAMIMSAIRP